MRTVYVESCLANDVSGHVIAYVTRSNVQHSAFVTTDENGVKDFRYEALRSKGYVRRLYVPRDNVKLREITVTDDQFARMKACAESMVGTKYPHLLWLGLEYAIPLVNHQLRTVYCSQAIEDILTMGGLYDKSGALIKPSPGVMDAVALALEKSTETLAARQDLRTLGK